MQRGTPTVVEQGHARAQFNLGVCYGQGEGVAKNEAEVGLAQGDTVIRHCRWLSLAD